VFRAPPEQATLLLLKVWDSNPLLHKEFLGQALVRLPASYEDEDADDIVSNCIAGGGASATRDPLSLPAAGGVRWEEGWHALTPGRKHADELARRLARQGRKQDDLGEVLLRVSRLSAEAEEAAAGRGATLAAPGDAGHEADPEAYLHVDISAARHLLPADIEKGREALTSSDPYCVVKLWPTAAHEPDHASPLQLPLSRSVPVPALDRRLTLLPRIPGLTRDAPRDEEEDQSATKRRTRVVNDSLDPVWDAAFAFHPAEDATHVKVTVYDRDAVLNADDYLGEALIPLPARRGRDAPPLGDVPPPSAEERALADIARRRHANHAPQPGIVEGWFPLRCDARHAGELTRIQRRLGREEDLSPPALGELRVRLSYGPERDLLDAEPAHRPGLRASLGRLTVRVIGAAELPDFAGADSYAVHALFEQQHRRTPAVAHSHSPAWPAASATFEWRVTELTSDVVLRVMDGDEAVGEVFIPLAQLLPVGGGIVSELARVPRVAPPSPRWYTILKPRHPGEALARLRGRPHTPLGRLCVAARLRLRTPLSYAYTAPEALPPARRPGRDLDAEPSVAHLTLAASRMLDAMLAPMVAPARTVLYLQSWQAPRLNAALALSLAAACSSWLWPLTRALWPLWLALIFVFNGCVSWLIHRDDPVYVWRDEAERDPRASRAARDRERLQRMHMEAERDARRARGENAPDPTASQSRNVVVLWRMVQAQIEAGQAACTRVADALERCCNALSWEDPHASACAAALLAATGLAASAALALATLAARASPLGPRHAVFAAGAACMAPFPTPLRRALDEVERQLQLNMPISVGPLTSGAGLEATATVRPGASVAEVRARIAREAAEAAAQAQAREEAAREARARQRGATLGFSPAEALRKLVDRSPTNARVTHLRIAARAAAPRPPAAPAAGARAAPKRSDAASSSRIHEE
jgi:hypothetical protein